MTDSDDSSLFRYGKKFYSRCHWSESKISFVRAGKSYWRGRVSTVDLLVQITLIKFLYVGNIIYFMLKQVILMRRWTVLKASPKLAFLGSGCCTWNLRRARVGNWKLIYNLQLISFLFQVQTSSFYWLMLLKAAACFWTAFNRWKLTKFCSFLKKHSVSFWKLRLRK